MAKEFILQENVLSDNILVVPNSGKVFRGGYVALVKEYHYKNPWSDKETVKKFRSKDRLNTYLNKYYPEAEIDFEGTCLE